MKFKTAAVAAIVAALSLSACGGGRGTEPAPEGTETNAPAAGFAADATIGVALPWLGTQNWKEAEVMFKDQLTKAGFTPLVQAADNKVPQQQQQIESMIQNGAKAIVVGPVDGKQLGPVLENAKAEGILILGYDRLIENTAAIDGVVQFGAVRTGELQGNALLDGLAAEKGDGPYNIELFGGGPADPNAPLFFEGAMKVLQPKIDDGTLVVQSGQTEFTQAATPDWDNAKAQARMDSLLSGFYSDKKIDGVLSPNDGIGLDAENGPGKGIWEGRQYSTVAKPTDLLVSRTVELIQAAQKGEALPAGDDKTNNGVIDVPIFQLDPVVVTKANIKEVFANDPERLALLEG